MIVAVDASNQKTRTLKVIEKTGVTFGVPAAGTNTRKVTSDAVNGGTLTADGVAARWAAVDTVGERLLATGAVDEPKLIAVGQEWSLQSIIIHQPKVA